MAPLYKRARDNNDSPNDGNDKRQRREEKRRREDERVAEADTRLEKEQRAKRRERQRARKAGEEVRIRAAVAEYVATHMRTAKGARTCWECKQRHGCCGAVACAEPSVAQALGDMAAQVFDLSVTSLNRSEARQRLERKVDALTEKVQWIAGVMGAADAAAGERDLKMTWARSLEKIAPGSEEDADGADDRMEVDEAKAPSTSDTGDADNVETTDEEEEEEEEEEKEWKGKGKARNDEETSKEEESEGSED